VAFEDPGRVFAVSEELKRHMVAEGFSDGRVDVVYNGIEIGACVTPEERAAARAELGFPAKALVVGSVARLDPVKNLSLLLQAHAFAPRIASGCARRARWLRTGTGGARG